MLEGKYVSTITYNNSPESNFVGYDEELGDAIDAEISFIISQKDVSTVVKIIVEMSE